MTNRSDTWVRRAGFACGLATMAALFAGMRMPAQPPGLGLDLTIVPDAPASLTLKPAGALLTAAGLRTGGEGARGRVTVVNSSDRAQEVRLRAVPQSRALDQTLMVDARLGGTTLYRGPLGALRVGSARAFRIESGDGRDLRLRVWLPRGAAGWRGRIEDVNLRFEATKEEGR